jgi:hypothetical protein
MYTYTVIFYPFETLPWLSISLKTELLSCALALASLFTVSQVSPSALSVMAALSCLRVWHLLLPLPGVFLPPPLLGLRPNVPLQPGASLTTSHLCMPWPVHFLLVTATVMHNQGCKLLALVSEELEVLFVWQLA